MQLLPLDGWKSHGIKSGIEAMQQFKEQDRRCSRVALHCTWIERDDGCDGYTIESPMELSGWHGRSKPVSA